ncbi:MAG: tRNA (cytidine(56)-2'-O)-methyltransferase, partial [Promethearchaeota archaeon]
EKIIEVRDRFGGEFFVEIGQKWKDVVRSWNKSEREIIHLTMYGIPLPNIIENIRGSQKDKLIVIGGAKTPPFVYKIATYNVSITNQPHSEIAALAIFLDYYFQGKEFDRKFDGAKLEIIPDKKEKIVRKAADNTE